MHGAIVVGMFQRRATDGPVHRGICSHDCEDSVAQFGGLSEGRLITSVSVWEMSAVQPLGLLALHDSAILRTLPSAH